MIRVSVVGAKGRMGATVVDAVKNAPDTELAKALDAGDDLTQITPENTDVVVEFTVPAASLDNVLALVNQGVNVVVGTTGWTDEKLAQVREAIANGPRPSDQGKHIAQADGRDGEFHDHIGVGPVDAGEVVARVERERKLHVIRAVHRRDHMGSHTPLGADNRNLDHAYPPSHIRGRGLPNGKPRRNPYARA